MDSNSISGGLYSNMTNPGMLGLEMSLHPSQITQNPPQVQHQTMLYSHNEPNYQPQIAKNSKSKNQALTLSDDEEHGAISIENSADDGRRKSASPWQRMKWTDDMVRLLIMVVFYIGDEVGSEGGESVNKKKCGGVLQKKGKWKSVSRALMERGFYVSPQQCEDKFNDLNKRYKRVNDILGKGTACQVVENQSLLDGMDRLSVKLKEEVKKLLNSKHLFFREMCAYHNSCGHGTGAASAGGEKWTETAGVAQVAAALEPVQQAQVLQSREKRCLHMPENVRNMVRGESEGSKMAKRVGLDDDEDGDDDEDDDDDDEDDDDHSNDLNEMSSMKRQKKGSLIQQLDSELMNVLHEGTKSPYEKRVWMSERTMQLEEQRVGIQWRTLELEKQRLKWLKFSTKKEREMEREKLANERLRLENERMVLLIRQKEEDFLDHHRRDRHRSGVKKSDPSSIDG